MNIRYPHIIGGTDREQIKQLTAYLYQLVEQLNLSSGKAAQPVQAPVLTPMAAQAASEEEARSNFDAVKALIIKSADIVNAYYEQIERKLAGVYAAEASFPDGSASYVQKTEAAIQANSNSITQNFANIQQLSGLVNDLIDTNAWIKTGLLEETEGVPVYGLEVGQKINRNGQEVFNRYARFTADRLSFYDRHDNEVAYVSDRKLYIRSAQIQEELQVGRFVTTVQQDGSTVKRWIANTTQEG